VGRQTLSRAYTVVGIEQVERDGQSTGTIPESHIGDVTMARGFPNLVDTVQVKHVSGGYSQIQFKAYEQGREAWQGETLTGGIWFDEEPDIDIWGEGIARLAPGAVAYLTSTPLLGISEVVCQFYPHPENPDYHLTQMDISDAGHYTAAERAQRIAGYLPHEREARSRGIPLLGSGRIFPIADSELEEDAIEKIPSHWPQLIGLDFGYDHPFAAVHGAWDRDADVVHILKAYREREKTPPIHVAAIKPWGAHLRCSWPHDGTHTQPGDGVTLAAIYKKAGLKMLPEHATFHSGGYHVEPGITEMLTRMQTKRIQVARHLKEWFAEFRTYHRKNGKIVKERDDLMDATRTLLMCLRFARTTETRRHPAVVGMDYQPLSAG